MTLIFQLASLDTLPTLSCNSSTLNTLRDSKANRDSKIHKECSICLSNDSKAEMVSTCSNKHRFCKVCVSQYLINRVNQSKVLKIPCPEAGCQEVLTVNLIQSILNGPDFDLYQRRVLGKLINRNPNSKFCPKPGCSQFFTPSEGHSFTQCECGTLICNICNSFHHEGKSCFAAIDAEFQLFSIENELKFCVMCKSVVQRVQGCLHITCPVCDYEWCWTCGRQFTPSHERECPKDWQPVPPARTKNKVLNKLNQLENFPILKSLLFLLSLPIIILVLPMFILGITDNMFRPSVSKFEQICMGSFGVLLSIAYNFAIIAMICQLIQGGAGLLLIIPLLVLLIPYVIYVKKYIDRRRGVGTFSMHRWTTGDANLFKYTSTARPSGQLDTIDVVSNLNGEGQTGEAGELQVIDRSNQNTNAKGNDLKQEKSLIQNAIAQNELRDIIVA